LTLRLFLTEPSANDVWPPFDSRGTFFPMSLFHGVLFLSPFGDTTHESSPWVPHFFALIDPVCPAGPPASFSRSFFSHSAPPSPLSLFAPVQTAFWRKAHFTLLKFRPGISDRPQWPEGPLSRVSWRWKRPALPILLLRLSLPSIAV